MKDDPEFNIRFVSLVEAHPCLYDSTREDYRLSHVQEHAWTVIAATIGDGATSQQCKSRWKNLRGSYTKHIKNYATSGSGSSTKRPYYLAKYISFILPFTKSHKSKRNTVASTSKQSPATYDEAIFTDELETQDLDCENEKSRGEEDNRQDVKHEDPEVKYEGVDWIAAQEDLRAHYQQDILEKNNPATANDKAKLKSRNKKRKIQKTSAPLSKIKKSKRKKIRQSKITVDDVNKSVFEYFEILRKLPDICTTDDADAHFLLSLLPDFKKMKDSQKRRFKMGILKLAGQILDETSCGTAEPSSFGGGSTSNS